MAASSNSEWTSILNDLNRDVSRQQPDDFLQFLADWAQDRLRQERKRSSASMSPGGGRKSGANLPSYNSGFSGGDLAPDARGFNDPGPTDGPFGSGNGNGRRATHPGSGFNGAAGAAAGGAAIGAGVTAVGNNSLFSSPFGGSNQSGGPHGDDSSPFGENAPASSPFGPSAQTPSAPVGKGRTVEPEPEEEEESEGEEPPVPSYALGRRTSVSAESLVPSHARQPFDSNLSSFPEEEDEESSINKMPNFPKSPEQVARIREAIKDNFLFKNLDEEQEADVLGAMKEINIPANDMVIEQGAAGDYFYIVEKGQLEIFVKRDGAPIEPEKGDRQDLGKKVATSKEGSSFGELALMHNAPRAASIVSVTPCTLWALDRVSFRTILLDHTSRKRRLYESFLSTVPILSSLQPAERAKIADVLESRTFDEGQDVITQGDMGDEFFLIESGSAVAIRNMDGKDQIVKKYSPGDFFGELALLNRQTRAATVRATEKLRVAALGEQAFTRLLGPVKDIMSRTAAERYGW